jgi:hypothetical protein
MSIVTNIRNALSSIAGTPVTSPAAPPDPREALRQAVKAVELAQARLDEERAITERLQGLQRAVLDAEDEADAAEKAYSDSITVWARRATSGDTVGDGELARRAEAARQRANRAKLAAEGAERALSGQRFDGNASRYVTEPVTQSELDARNELERVTSTAKHARWPILVAEIQPTLERAEALHAELKSLIPKLESFDAWCDYASESRGDTRPFRERYREVRSLPRYFESDRANMRWTWERFDNRLKQDPDAEF